MQPELLDNFLVWAKGSITGSVRLYMMKLLLGMPRQHGIYHFNKNGDQDDKKTPWGYKTVLLIPSHYEDNVWSVSMWSRRRFSNVGSSSEERDRLSVTLSQASIPESCCGSAHP